MKIGITTDGTKNIWSSGEVQYFIFLYDILTRGGAECFYLHLDKAPPGLGKRCKHIKIFDALKNNAYFDIIIIGSFFPSYMEISRLLEINPKCKIIYVNFLNKHAQHSHGALFSHATPSSSVLSDLYFLFDEIWILPHHADHASYIKTIFHNENVRIAPYIWDSYFIHSALSQDENAKISYSPTDGSNLNALNQVCIFEPNKSFTKNFLLSLALCERAVEVEKTVLESVNIFNCKKIRSLPYFQALVKKFNLVKQNKVYFNNRWNFPDALRRWGGTIVSHQKFSELNYLYFECLYLGLPLVHNSTILEEYGYSYKSDDIVGGARQLKTAVSYHKENFDYYRGQVTGCLSRYSIYNAANVEGYKLLLHRLEP